MPPAGASLWLWRPRPSCPLTPDQTSKADPSSEPAFSVWHSSFMLPCSRPVLRVDEKGSPAGQHALGQGFCQLPHWFPKQWAVLEKVLDRILQYPALGPAVQLPVTERECWRSGALVISNVFTSFGFPGASDGQECACNAGDLSLIPGSRRSYEERNGNRLQYSCLKNPKDKGAWQAAVHGVAETQTSFSSP